MKKLLVLAMLCLASCNQMKGTANASVQMKQNQRAMRAAHLSKDDLLILEIHYPSLLNKIVTQHSLTVHDVCVLSEIGISSEVLIHLIKYTKSSYMLTTDDVVGMQLGGVPFEVINFMIES